MSPSKLPERASLEYLKKLAKERLQVLRRADPRAKLASALLEIAREYGFSSWRALKAEIDQRQNASVVGFFDACARGDVEAVRDLLAAAPGLAQATAPTARYSGWTALHAAAKEGHVAAVRLLLEHGADVNAREAGDNTYPLHWAAAHGHTDTVRALVDAGGDVHGVGDLHEQEVIGWASSAPASRREVMALLVERGARHHIFSAMAVGDLDLIRQVVAHDPGALDRRMSRFEQGRTPLHEAIERKRYDILDLLIELGADVDAADMHGRTPLAVAMLKGDREAMARLHAAGAPAPAAIALSSFTSGMASLADSVKKLVPMIHAPDVVKTLDWYKWLGFHELTRYADETGEVNFGMVAFGKAEIMLNKYGDEHHGDVSLWFYTDRIDDLYQSLKSRQIEAARVVLAGEEPPQGIEFEQDIEDMFYGARQFAIRDPNGYSLTFIRSR